MKNEIIEDVKGLVGYLSTTIILLLILIVGHHASTQSKLQSNNWRPWTPLEQKRQAELGRRRQTIRWGLRPTASWDEINAVIGCYLERKGFEDNSDKAIAAYVASTPADQIRKDAINWCKLQIRECLVGYQNPYVIPSYQRYIRDIEECHITPDLGADTVYIRRAKVVEFGHRWDDRRRLVLVNNHAVDRNGYVHPMQDYN